MNRKMLSRDNFRADMIARKEFSSYKGSQIARIQKLIYRYPKIIYVIMLLCMLSSAVVFASCTINRKTTPALRITNQAAAGAPSGLAQIVATGIALKKVWELQIQVEALLHQDTLSSVDSLLLGRLQRRLELPNHQNQFTP